MLSVIGKGNKERLVPVGDRALEAIYKYHGLRSKLVKSKAENALFLNHHGRRITTRAVRKIINNWVNASALKNIFRPIR